MDNFTQTVTNVNGAVNDIVWGVPALVLLIGTGVLMTVLTRFFQFRRFGHMWRNTIGALFNKDKGIRKSQDVHSISQFQSLCTALSATIGTGNIAGVAYAITMGGPGAVFWMWIAAIVGMMTNYSENVLGIFFRCRNEKGEWSGGAMYYLKDGVGKMKYGKAAGGAGGAIIAKAMTWGFKRGVFSNEAGLGSSVMVHSASNVKEPVVQGLWGIFEVFADTIIVCTCTALVILTTGVVDIETGVSVSGASKLGLATEAFTKSFGTFGGIFLAVAVCLFAFTTILGWSYYGTKAWEYLFGTKSTVVYKVIFIAMVAVGAIIDVSLAIDLSDTFNGLMAIPNLIGVVCLSSLVVKLTKNYSDRKITKKDPNLKPMLSAFPEIQKEQEARED